MFLFVIFGSLVVNVITYSVFEEYLCVYERDGEISDIGCFLDDCPAYSDSTLYSSIRMSVKNCFKIRDGLYTGVPYCEYRCSENDQPNMCLTSGDVCPDYNEEGCPRFLSLIDFTSIEDCEKYRDLQIDEAWCIMCMETLEELVNSQEPELSDTYCQSGIPDELCVAARYIVDSDDETDEEELERKALELCSKGKYDDPNYNLETCSNYKFMISPTDSNEERWPLWIVILSMVLLGFNLTQFVLCVLMCTWCFDIYVCFTRYLWAGKCFCRVFLCLFCGRPFMGEKKNKKKSKKKNSTMKTVVATSGDDISPTTTEELDRILYKNGMLTMPTSGENEMKSFNFSKKFKKTKGNKKMGVHVQVRGLMTSEDMDDDDMMEDNEKEIVM